MTRPALQLVTGHTPPQPVAFETPQLPADIRATHTRALSLFLGEMVICGEEVVTTPKVPAMSDIAREVARLHDLTLDQLRGPRRDRYVAWPRQEFMWQAYATGRYSNEQIARYVSRDHTSVIHGRRAHAKRKGLKTW